MIVPGAWAIHGGETIKIWRAQPLECANAVAPGTIIASSRAGVDVACGNGTVLRLMELQRSGGKRLPAEAFLQGTPLRSGDRLLALDGGADA